MGLYIHFPYCIHKCVYCDFNVYELKAKRHIENYLTVLKKEISYYSAKYPRTIDTIYLGGGTPSLLLAEQASDLFGHVYKEFEIPRANALGMTNAGALGMTPVEITIEANPYVSYEKLAGFKEAGINRLSFGIQTFHSKHLKTLERRHTSTQAVKTFKNARKAGFDNINLDFIFGIPGQSLKEFQRDISKALALNPEHLSTYNLTVEESNPLSLHMPSESLQAKMYEWVSAYLPLKGYEHYETSAFAQEGKKSQHNLKYWRFLDYLGVGAGAYSYMREKDNPWGVHFKNVENVSLYSQKILEKGHAIEEKEVLSKEVAKKDFMQTHLRLISQGVSEELFKERFKETFENYGKAINHLKKEGFLDFSGKMLTLTSKGKLYLNQVLLEFM